MAFMTPMRANIAGPSCSLHRGLPFVGVVFCFGQFGDVFCGVAERHQRFPVRQCDRIEKPLIPGHRPGAPGLPAIEEEHQAHG
jgi:hypothetical protein